MVCLVTLLQAAQNTDGVIYAGLAHVHLLEAALQCGVLLDVLAVLIQGGRTDQAQLATGKHGLEHVARVHGAFGCASADDGVNLVDEGHNLAFGLLDFLEDCLQALLEFTAVLCACDHGAQVQADEGLAAQGFGHVAGNHALCQALDHGGLTDAGLTNQHGVVLGAAGEHLHDAANLGITADDRVELAGAGNGGQVGAVLFERLEGAFGVGGIHGAVSSDVGDGLCDEVCGSAELVHCFSGAIGSAGDAQQNHFGGDVGVPEALCAGLRSLQGGKCGTAKGGVLHGGARCLGQLLDFCGSSLGDGVYIQACCLEHGDCDAFALVHEGLEDVRGFNSGVTRRLRIGVSGGDNFLTLGRELNIHGVLSYFEGFILCVPALHNLSLLRSTMFRNPLAKNFFVFFTPPHTPDPQAKAPTKTLCQSPHQNPQSKPHCYTDRIGRL